MTVIWETELWGDGDKQDSVITTWRSMDGEKVQETEATYFQSKLKRPTAFPTCLLNKILISHIFQMM